MLGLIQGVGWHIHGGLLARQRLDGATLELYGKETTRKRGGFLGFDTYHKLEDVSYDFFLLRRPADGSHATILEKWSIPSEDIAWQIPAPSAQYPGLAHGEAGARSDVRGFLRYDPATKIATVTVTGLKQTFQQRVLLSDN